MKVNVKLSAELHAAIKKEKERTGVTLAFWIEDAIRTKLNNIPTLRHNPKMKTKIAEISK